MVDPLSLAAVTAALGAVGSGMANEAGKWAWETAGGLVRRIAGREVEAPADPGELAGVARMVHDGLHRDPGLARVWSAFAQSVPQHGAATARPELPPSVRFFTDREEAMEQLDEEASRAADGRPRIALLHGAPGMGTSALAVHWGCREAGRFPDGQVYVDLRGSSTGSALDGDAVLRAVLRQLGTPKEETPPAAAERIETYRRLVSQRRLLIVLDHAHTATQIRPLLTSAPGVLLLIVASAPLTGIDALRIRVGPLKDRDAVRLLTQLEGKTAVDRARAVLPSVLARCGGSPFALRAAAPRLSAAPPSADARPKRPDTDTDTDTDTGADAASSTTAASAAAPAASDPVHAAAEDAYSLLGPVEARLYRLMSLRPWPQFGPEAAAWAADIGRAEAASALDKLVGARLVERTDTGRCHYRPEVRRHAENAAREDGIGACAAATSRVVEGFLHLALRAAAAALPESWRVPSLPEGLPEGTYADRAEAVQALSDELGNLLEAVRTAAEFGDETTAVTLAQALWPLQLKAGHHDELVPVLRVAVRIADDRFHGTRVAGALHAHLGHSLVELRRWAEAETEITAAAAHESTAGHMRGHASAVELLGLLRLRQWRFAEADACFDEAGRIYDTIGPGDEGAADLPRARALLRRHHGRALRGLARPAEARESLGEALEFFRSAGDTYNTARTLTDLAVTALDEDDRAGALPLVEEAMAALTSEGARYHLAYLRSLRERCDSPGPA
jgi:tetratricopeptide (TPR) repeat protein